jgi:hypothetical protein
MQINATEKLANEDLDFEILAIGRWEIESIPENILKYFDIKPRLPFDEMYGELENSDFFLPLLDPTNESHFRYTKTGVTGGAQLVYGFLKPPVVCRDFAKFYSWDEKNSIIYDDVSLEEGMKQAILITNSDYKSLQNNMKRLQDGIYKQSLKNLKGILERAKKDKK